MAALTKGQFRRAYAGATNSESRGTIGLIEGALQRELCEQPRRQEIERLVFFHDFLETGEINRAYGYSPAPLLPSLEMQIGTVVREALAMELSVILSEHAAPGINWCTAV